MCCCKVDYVIREATNLDNLAVLYEGWTPWVWVNITGMKTALKFDVVVPSRSHCITWSASHLQSQLHNQSRCQSLHSAFADVRCFYEHYSHMIAYRSCSIARVYRCSWLKSIGHAVRVLLTWTEALNVPMCLGSSTYYITRKCPFLTPLPHVTLYNSTADPPPRNYITLA